MATQPWPTPPINEILNEQEAGTNQANVLRQKRLIETTLAELGYEAKIHQVQQGPRLTRYNLTPESATQLSKIRKSGSGFGRGPLWRNGANRPTDSSESGAGNFSPPSTRAATAGQGTPDPQIDGFPAGRWLFESGAGA